MRRLLACVDMFVRVRSRCDMQTMRDPVHGFNGPYSGADPRSLLRMRHQRAMLARSRRDTEKAGRVSSSRGGGGLNAHARFAQDAKTPRPFRDPDTPVPVSADDPLLQTQSRNPHWIQVHAPANFFQLRLINSWSWLSIRTDKGVDLGPAPLRQSRSQPKECPTIVVPTEKVLPTVDADHQMIPVIDNVDAKRSGHSAKRKAGDELLILRD